MSWRGTVVLALLAAVVGTYLWLEPASDSQQEGPGALGESPTRAPTEPLRPLLVFKPAEVVLVHLEHNGQMRETQRQNGSWGDVNITAAIDDFLNNLAALGILAEIPATAADLTDYGLQPPRSIVRLQLRDRSTPLLLELGDRNPATTGVYVRLSDTGAVVLGGALVAWEFEKAFKALAPAEVPG